MGTVRGLIDRETAGVVSPARQVVAVGDIVRKSQERIDTVMQAARVRHGGVLSAPDALRLAFHLVEHATFVFYWLRLSQDFRRLPSSEVGKRSLSIGESTARRNTALRAIHLACAHANELLTALHAARPPSGGLIERLFRQLAVQMLCIEILAELIVGRSTTRESGRTTLDEMIVEAESTRTAPDFQTLEPGVRDLLWQTLGALYGVVGETEKHRAALNERRALTDGSTDARLRLLVETIDFAATDEERLAILAELTEIARTQDADPLFSRERVGRLSILRDRLWSCAAEIDEASPYATEAVREAMTCYQVWLFGRDSPLGAGTIQLISDFQGRGRMAWRTAEGANRLASLDVETEVATRFFGAMERLESLGSAPARRMTKLLNTVVAPLLEEAVEPGTEVRLQMGGAIGHFPILMTTVGGRPLGSSGTVAYAHPNPSVTRDALGSEPFDLLIIDDTFDGHSEAVMNAFERAAITGASDARVLRFNSDSEGEALAHAVFEEALLTASNALLFCHVQSFAWLAHQVAVITGRGSRYLAQGLVELNLCSLKELAVIGCGSGRPDLFVGDLTVAHAGAVAGARQVLCSLWPIRPKQGATFVEALLSARSAGVVTSNFLADLYGDRPAQAAPFMLIRP